jgi:hypothetical protein
MAFNLDDYEPVEARITAFWAKYPEGRIHTEIVLINEQQIVIKASVWTDREDQRPVTVDFAQETIGATNITKNSWLEVCATSAIGRALADLDFAKKGKRPSREEMRKAKPSGARYVPAPTNWLAEAEKFAEAKDVDGLRALYQSAVKHVAGAEILDAIKVLADTLKAV